MSRSIESLRRPGKISSVSALMIPVYATLRNWWCHLIRRGASIFRFGHGLMVAQPHAVVWLNVIWLHGQ